jgi:uncharacterized protein (DUF2267 family)
MPMPYTYRHASAEFRAFLDDVKDGLGLDSDNSAYTAVDGVFRTFRRRLTPAQALAFSGALPAVLRAIFVQDWQDAPPVPFAPMHEMAAEAQALRRDHNLTPPDAIVKVARAVWRAADTAEFDRALNRLPPEARIFWDPGPVSEGDLSSRFA